MPLNSLTVKHAKPTGKPFKLTDEAGLYLLVTAQGSSPKESAGVIQPLKFKKLSKKRGPKSITRCYHPEKCQNS